MRDSWGALGLGVGAQGADHEPTEALWFQERSFNVTLASRVTPFSACGDGGF